jgi:DNA-directed RNA polymerase specialized sigma24 family protein
MDKPPISSMNEQDEQISEIVAEERSRLRNFIRRRVLDPADAEDILQEGLLQTGRSQSAADAD